MRVDSLLNMKVDVDGVARNVCCERCWGEGDAGKYFRVTVNMEGYMGKSMVFHEEKDAILAAKTITSILNDVLSEARHTYEENY